MTLVRDPATLDLISIRQEFHTHGYARLGVWADESTLQGLRERLTQIQRGELDHTPYFFQKDSPSGRYETLSYGKGWEGPSDDYRKIEKLERDDRFLAWLRNPLFETIARNFIGDQVFLYRALVFAKSERGGTFLPWHQDGGAFWGLNKEPFLQIWTALDDASENAGCLEVFEGSHLGGLASPDGGVVQEHLVKAMEATTPLKQLPAKAGEVILIHNHLWHRSGRNHSGKPRRAFTACLLSEDTKCLRRKRAPREFFRVFPA